MSKKEGKVDWRTVLKHSLFFATIVIFVDVAEQSGLTFFASHRTSFRQLCKHSGSDKCSGVRGSGPWHSGHDYENMYEFYVEQIRDEDIAFLEIGIGSPKAYSMHMWRRFFHSARMLNFLDITDFTASAIFGTTIWIGDETDAALAQRIAASCGGSFDVVIDDGSHIPSHVFKIFQHYWPLIKPGGLYVIEDMNTGYAVGDGLGYYAQQNKGTESQHNFPKQHELVKSFIDTLNRINFNSSFTAGVGGIDHNIESVHCMTEICVMRKAGGRTSEKAKHGPLQLSSSCAISLILFCAASSLYSRLPVRGEKAEV